MSFYLLFRDFYRISLSPCFFQISWKRISQDDQIINVSLSRFCTNIVSLLSIICFSFIFFLIRLLDSSKFFNPKIYLYWLSNFSPFFERPEKSTNELVTHDLLFFSFFFFTFSLFGSFALVSLLGASLINRGLVE